MHVVCHNRLLRLRSTSADKHEQVPRGFSKGVILLRDRLATKQEFAPWSLSAVPFETSWQLISDNAGSALVDMACPLPGSALRRNPEVRPCFG